ncbi:uncharacterized protein LOC134221038 [Armigeres subalbatus]|uniref:uncharacterized protein LOC134221038 n=1 Tax=Armigeres subalbatus TaxID=124917 RepID=UPI002ED42501
MFFIEITIYLLDGVSAHCFIAEVVICNRLLKWNRHMSTPKILSIRSSPIPSPKQMTSILKPTGSIRKGDKRVTMCERESNLSPTFIEILNENLARKSGPHQSASGKDERSCKTTASSN